MKQRLPYTLDKEVIEPNNLPFSSLPTFSLLKHRKDGRAPDALAKHHGRSQKIQFNGEFEREGYEKQLTK